MKRAKITTGKRPQIVGKVASIVGEPAPIVGEAPVVEKKPAKERKKKNA